MMNKSKSAKRQLGRFLFLVPVLAIILLSFRHSFKQTPGENTVARPVLTDTIPDITIANSKGYYIDIKDDNGNCTVVVKDKDKKEVKRVLLTEWNAKDDYYENLYGEILSPLTEPIKERIKANNPAITKVTIKGNVATVTLKNGKTEVYTLSLKDQKKAFEERCDIKELPIASIVPVETTVAEPVTTVKEVNVLSETIADDFEINDNKAVMKMRNGKVEEYNLADPKEKAAFEKKFGKIYTPALTTTGVYSVVSVAETAEPSISTTVTVAPAKEVALIDEHGAITVVEEDETITIEPDVLITITQKTTKEELSAFQAAVKMKGFELSFDETEYKNGLLVKISGTLKSKNGQANFVGIDFNKIIISQVKKGDKTYFRIDEVAKKKGVS